MGVFLEGPSENDFLVFFPHRVRSNPKNFVRPNNMSVVKVQHLMFLSVFPYCIV